MMVKELRVKSDALSVAVLWEFTPSVLTGGETGTRMRKLMNDPAEKTTNPGAHMAARPARLASDTECEETSPVQTR